MQQTFLFLFLKMCLICLFVPTTHVVIVVFISQLLYTLLSIQILESNDPFAHIIVILLIKLIVESILFPMRGIRIAHQVYHKFLLHIDISVITN